MRGPSHDHVGELYLSVNKSLGQLQDPFVSPWTRTVMAPAPSPVNITSCPWGPFLNDRERDLGVGGVSEKQGVSVAEMGPLTPSRVIQH